jgi:hypothetical protein
MPRQDRHLAGNTAIRAKRFPGEVHPTPTIFFGARQRLNGVLPWSAFEQAACAGLAAQPSK